MAYELDQFISDCRSILERDPGPAGREQVRNRLEHLLQNPDFVRRHCEQAPRGLHVLYEDPGLGFQILAHINDKARTSPPHDHGASWAIYGQATHYTDMTEWEREDDGRDTEHAKLKPVKKYRLMPGQAGIYQDGKIHSIDYGGELALVDVREELIYSQGHLLLARSAPLSRLELKFAGLVPRHETRIVLCD